MAGNTNVAELTLFGSMLLSYGGPAGSSAGLLLAALAAILSVLALGWMRETMYAQRRTMRLLNQLCEEVIASNSPSDVLLKLNAAFSKVSRDMRVSLFVYSRSNRSLDEVASSAGTTPVSIRLDMPAGGVASGIVLCYRNRTLLTVPDTRRSPFFTGEERKLLPRSVLFVPMFAQTELIGVMEIDRVDKLHRFGRDEQAAMQHVANQVGTALRLQDQKAVRDRLFRSEKLAAAGQLISGITGELRSPLGSILAMTASLRVRKGGSNDGEIDLIESEAKRASEIVDRLVGFGRSAEGEAQAVDLHALLSRLLRLRGPARKAAGVETHPQFVNQNLLVHGSQAQLEQVFLTLIVHAEQVAGQSREPAMSITSSLLAGRVLVEIGYNSAPSDKPADPFESEDGEEAGSGLGVCLSIVHNHGGELRFTGISPTQNRFEVELPVMETPQFRQPAPASEMQTRRTLTILLIEPDQRSQKQILVSLAKRSDRVVPVSSAEEAADLAQRFRFDLTICSARLPDSNWVELFERVRRYIGTFVLLTQGYDPELVKAFHSGEGFVLSKPIDESQLRRICDSIADKTNVKA